MDHGVSLIGHGICAQNMCSHSDMKASSRQCPAVSTCVLKVYKYYTPSFRTVLFHVMD